MTNYEECAFLMFSNVFVSCVFTKHIEIETVQYNARADILENLQRFTRRLTNCVTFLEYKPCMLSSKGLIDKTAGIRELLKSFIMLSVNR